MKFLWRCVQIGREDRVIWKAWLAVRTFWPWEPPPRFTVASFSCRLPKLDRNLPTCHTCVTMCKHIGTGTKNHPPATNRWVPTVLGVFANSFTLFLANHFLSPSVPAPWPYVWSAWPCHPCLKNSPAVTQLIGEKKREENRRKAEKCWNVSSRHISNPSPLVHSGRMQLRAQAKMESGESSESGWVKKECHNEGGWLWMSSWLQCSEKAEIFSFLQLGSTRNLAHARHAGRAQAQTARSLSGFEPLTGLTEQEKNAPTIIICHRTHWEFCLTDSPDTYKYNRNTEYFDHKSWWSYHICAIYFRRLHWFLWFLCVCLSYPLVIKRWSGLWCSQTWLELLRNDEENAMLGLAKSTKSTGLRLDPTFKTGQNLLWLLILMFIFDVLVIPEILILSDAPPCVDVSLMYTIELKSFWNHFKNQDQNQIG